MNLKKRVLMVVLMASIIIVPAKAVQFLDVTPNYWGYEAIMEFAQKGYLSGYEDGTFKPDFTITRAEFAHVINNYFGFTGNENVVTTLSDVDQNEWYAKGVNEAVARGYMIGYEDGTFRPNTPITRQEAIVVLAKILNLNDNTSSDVALEYLKSKFSDYSAVEPWALNAVYNFSNLGYINGYEDGTLRIGTSMTRAEVVHMVKPVEQKIVVDKEEQKPSKGGSGGGGSSSRVTYYEITVNPTENGAVEVSSTRVQKGNSVTVTVTPAEGYELVELLDNNQVVSVVNGIYTIENVQTNHTISATFRLIPEEPVVKYTITVTSNEKGTATPAEAEIEEGKEITITLTPGEAYRLYALTDNGTDVIANVVEGAYTISNVQENHAVVATFGCNCEEAVAELIETIKGIVDTHVDIFVEKLEACEGNAEAIKTEIETVLGEKIENSEYKAEIEAVIAELEAVDYQALSAKALAVLGKIVCSEKFENAMDKLENLVTAEEKAEIEALLNKIETKINDEVANIKIEIENFIENHDCVKVQAFITKLNNKLQSIDSMETLIKEVEKYIKANVSKEDIEKAIEAITEKYNCTIEELKAKLQENKDKIVEEITNKIVKAKEYQDKIEEVIAKLKEEIKDAIPTDAELKAMAEELLAKGEATLETLKAKLEEKVAEREAKIQEVIDQIKAEIKENLPTEAELRVMAEELLAKNQAKLDTLKEKLIAKLKGELEDVSDKWEEYVDQIKDQIIANLPSEEIFNDLISKIDSVMPKIEEMTGIDFSDVAARLGIDADTVSEAIEAITQNEALKELVVNTLKDKVTDLIANELSNNETIKAVLDKVYESTEKDVVDAIIELSVKDTPGITVKIILSNTELEDVLVAIDGEITEEDLTIVVKACVDHYGLAEFIQAVDSCSVDYSAKELIKVALKNANAEELVKLVSDNKTQEIILNHLDAEEIIEVLGDVGKEILGDKFEDILGGSVEEALTFTTVTYDANAKNVSGKTKDSTHNKFFGVALTTNGFTRDGYTFKGWATSKDGSVKYKDGQSLKSTDFSSTEVTLYAVWEAKTYTITSWADEFGNSVTAKAEAKTDEEVKITVEEVEWYDIVEIKVNGVKVTGNSFVMPAEDAEIIATAVYTYVPPTAHAIKVASTTNGSVIPSATSAIKETPVTITVSPDTGYELDVLVVNAKSGSEVTVTDNKFTMPNEEVTITATFKAIKYDVEVTTTDLATVTASLAEATVEDTVTVTVTNIKEGYELINVTANGNSLEGENGVYSFEMYADNVTIEVEIEAIDYTVTINGEIPDGCSATVNLKDSIADANVGDTITVICKATLGYRVKITVDADIISSEATADYAETMFSMPANDVVVNVVFTTVPTAVVTVADVEGGSLKVSRDGINYAESVEAEVGETVYILVDADKGYELEDISAGNVKINDTKLGDLIKSFTMPSEDVEIEATFAQSTFDIKVIEDDDGIVEIEQKIYGISYPVTQSGKGEVVYIKAYKDGYVLKSIVVDDVDNVEIDLINGTASFVMPSEDVEISVEFEEILEGYTITIADVENGTISVDVSGEITAGKIVTVTAKGNKISTLKYYSISKVIITDLDGNEIETVDLNISLSGYKGTFEMPECDIIITGTFTK